MNEENQNNMFQPGMGGEKKGSKIGTIIVILIIVVGGIYLLASRGKDNTSTPKNISPTEGVISPTENNSTSANPSDELVSLEADASDASAINDLNTDLTQLDAELN